MECRVWAPRPLRQGLLGSSERKRANDVKVLSGRLWAAVQDSSTLYPASGLRWYNTGVLQYPLVRCVMRMSAAFSDNLAGELLFQAAQFSRDSDVRDVAASVRCVRD